MQNMAKGRLPRGPRNWMGTLLVAFLFQTACVHRSSVPTTSSETSSNGTARAQSASGSAPSERAEENPFRDPITSFEIAEDDKKDKTEEDTELETIPVEINPLVEKWIGYFQGRGRHHMERYLARSTRYEKLMKKVLRDNGLPEDLFYIALIESGFTSNATSHASAVGYWQFIRGTGKRYGLEINRMVDERRDPVLATQAAAEYFKGLYSLFGSWYLAMASYNVGENRVKREVMRNSTRDFWELVRKKRLPRETMNYVPKFIAAKLIAKNPDQYGFDGIDYMPPIEFETITVKESINLRAMSDKLNVPYEDFKAFNPKFKGEIAPAKNGLVDLRVPVGMSESGLQAAAASVADKVEFVADAGDTQVYRVRRGDNLSTIARRFRTNVAYLRELNDMSRRTRLRVGQKMYVPDRTPLADRKDPAAVAAKRTRQVPVAQVTGGEVVERGYRFYVVQSGDSLYSIAQRYNTSINELKKLNKLRKGRLIRVGLKLRVPGEVNSPQETTDRKDSSKRMTKKKYHIVRRGESLIQIAQRYDVPLSQIKKKNRIRNGHKIMAGDRLMIPRAVASQ
ncbi:MAG: LysM peptidoglycan-binding domain-containing protein [Bdellovibrionales bacterium]